MSAGLDFSSDLVAMRASLLELHTKRLAPSTEEERQLLADLVMRVCFTRVTNPHREHGRFSCYEEFVLEYGQFFRDEPLPEGLEYGELKLCYGNSFDIANDNDSYLYVEGFALKMISTQHAWLALCDDEDPAAIDVTWRDDRPRAYLGIAFDTGFARALILKQGVYGLLGGDYRMTHRLLELGLDKAVDGEYGLSAVYCAYGDGSLPEITDEDLTRLTDEDDED